MAWDLSLNCIDRRTLASSHQTLFFFWESPVSVPEANLSCIFDLMNACGTHMVYNLPSAQLTAFLSWLGEKGDRRWYLNIYIGKVTCAAPTYDPAKEERWQ